MIFIISLNVLWFFFRGCARRELSYSFSFLLSFSPKVLVPTGINVFLKKKKHNIYIYALQCLQGPQCPHRRKINIYSLFFFKQNLFLLFFSGGSEKSSSFQSVFCVDKISFVYSSSSKFLNEPQWVLLRGLLEATTPFTFTLITYGSSIEFAWTRRRKRKKKLRASSLLSFGTSHSLSVTFLFAHPRSLNYIRPFKQFSPVERQQQKRVCKQETTSATLVAANVEEEEVEILAAKCLVLKEFFLPFFYFLLRRWL